MSAIDGLTPFIEDAVGIHVEHDDLFIEKSFSRIACLCDLDAGIFGVRTINSKGLMLWVALPFGLGSAFIDELTALPFSPSIAECVMNSPRKVTYGSLSDSRWSSNLLAREMFADWKLFKAMSLAVEAPDEALSFFSGYRHQDRGNFTPKTAGLFEQCATIVIRLLAFRQALCPNSSAIEQAATTGRARVSLDGKIMHANEAFIKFFLMEWPTWKGVDIPIALQLKRLSPAPENVFIGRFIHITINSREAGYDFFVRKVTPIDFLTKRERLVAQLFSSGKSYKEVARKLRSSPSTVKTHLSHIYLKLNIHDKAELCALLNSIGSLHS